MRKQCDTTYLPDAGQVDPVVVFLVLAAEPRLVSGLVCRLVSVGVVAAWVVGGGLVGALGDRHDDED